MECDINMNSNNIVNISDFNNSQDAVTKNYLTNYHDYAKLNRSGNSTSCDLNMVNIKINNYYSSIYSRISISGEPVYVNSSIQLGTITSSRRFKDNNYY